MEAPGPAMRPGDGYTWSRQVITQYNYLVLQKCHTIKSNIFIDNNNHQLVFRAKLTQHTAFERADNTEPAAVTALALSKYDLCPEKLLSLFGCFDAD